MYTIDINAVVAGVYWLQLQSAVMRTRHSGKRANFPAQCHDTHWFTHSRCCHVTESKIYIFKCKQHIVTGFHVSTRSLLHMLHCYFSIAAQIGQTDRHTTGWENGCSALYHMLITNYVNPFNFSLSVAAIPRTLQHLKKIFKTIAAVVEIFWLQHSLCPCHSISRVGWWWVVGCKGAFMPFIYAYRYRRSLHCIFSESLWMQTNGAVPPVVAGGSVASWLIS